MKTFSKKTGNFLLFVYFLAWTLYFLFFWTRAVFFDQAGNLVSGHINIWGDWAAHFTMATAIATRGPFISSPFLIGQQFSYPFFADAVSGFLLYVHVPFLAAFLVPSFIFSVFFVWVLYFFYHTIFQSKKIAIIASLIFLLNGGIGFYYFAQDVFHSPNPVVTLVNPPHEYTRLDDQHIKWISVIDSMIIPQRAFVFGFPIALLGLTLIFQEVEKLQKKKEKERVRWWKVFAAGILIGSLPIIHTHSFLAVFIILFFWSLADIFFFRKFWQKHFLFWFAIVATVCVCALPIIHFLFQGHVSESFFQWYPGWLAYEFKMNWLLFWWKNWGATPLAAVVGAVIYALHQKQRPWQKIALIIPFFLLFIAANLFLFQPFSWDNTKIIVWSSVGISGLAGYCCVQLWSKKKIFAMFLFLLLTLSGAIDAYRILRIDLHSYVSYSADELTLADWVKNHTDPNSIWITSDQHNHWLYNLTGRQAVMTYRGWLWTYGYDYSDIERDEREMFIGAPNTLELLQKYHVNYVVIGDSERENFLANDTFFAQHFPVAYHLGTTTIYQVQP